MKNFYDLKVNQVVLISQKAVIQYRGKILLLQNTEGGEGKPPQWELPGGLLEINEESKKGLLREVLEETGLNIKVWKIFSLQTFWLKDFKLQDARVVDTRVMALGYLCELSEANNKPKLSQEHSAFKWFDPKKIKKLQLALNSREIVKDYLRNIVEPQP